MEDATGELIELADQAGAELEKLEELQPSLDALEDAAKSVGRAWSGSNVGYHARVYYEDFRPVPPNVVFSLEWGLEERWPVHTPDRGWTMYDDQQVRAAIINRSGGVRAIDIEPLLEPLRRRTNLLKEHLISILTVLSAKDEFLQKQMARVEELEALGPGAVARKMGPQGAYMTRDTLALGEGRRVATHFAVLSVPLAAKITKESLLTLEQTARLAAAHVRRSDPNQRAGVQTGGSIVFVGHGRSPLWRELKDFLKDRLKLSVSEFNAVSAAGIPTAERLKEMLDSALFAFIIMTGEDQQADGDLHARQNVIHEAGLFQGRLGFSKAIILLEEGCADFSNIHGLGHIPFPKGNIEACFEEVRRVLEREGLIG